MSTFVFGLFIVLFYLCHIAYDFQIHLCCCDLGDPFYMCSIPILVDNPQNIFIHSTVDGKHIHLGAIIRKSAEAIHIFVNEDIYLC
jgi:hypothetical protein